MSTDTTAAATDQFDQQLSIGSLLDEQGTIPFRGLTQSQEYPDDVELPADRRAVSHRAFSAAMQVLPQAGEGDLWADNEFVSVTADDHVTVDVEAIKDVHGLDPDSIEAETGCTIEQLISEASPEATIPVSDHKDIVDRRRLALRSLGFDCKFRWQIASSGYQPGDMQQFFRRKIAACQKQGIEDAFGWIRHYDWGGAVVMTTIYPEMEHTLTAPDTDIEIQDGKYTIAESDGVEEAVETDSGAATDGLTVYYGDRMGYDFRGSSTIWAYPVVFIPQNNVMIPLPSPRFSRRHEGEFMDVSSEREEGRKSPVEWHESILGKLEKISSTINTEILRSRVVAIDFSELPFGVQEFYEYLGLPASYAEPAANRATAIASPEDQPSIWTLQISLKLVLVDEFQGTKAGDTYQNYQEIAGQLLRFPAQQIQLALTEHEHQSEDDESETLLPEDQQQLADSLDDVVDLPGVTEDDLSVQGAQQVEQNIQERLSRFQEVSE